MRKIAVSITHAPFGHEQAFAGLYVASAALSKGLDAIVVLSGEGVYCASSGQIDPLGNINLPSTEEQVRDIIDMGGRIVVNAADLEQMGIGATDLIEGIEAMDSGKMLALLLEPDRAVVTL